MTRIFFLILSSVLIFTTSTAFAKIAASLQQKVATITYVDSSGNINTSGDEVFTALNSSVIEEATSFSNQQVRLLYYDKMGTLICVDIAPLSEGQFNIEKVKPSKKKSL